MDFSINFCLDGGGSGVTGRVISKESKGIELTNILNLIHLEFNMSVQV